MINFAMLSIITERRKTFDSLLANHFPAAMLRSHYGVKRLPRIMYNKLDYEHETSFSGSGLSRI